MNDLSHQDNQTLMQNTPVVSNFLPEQSATNLEHICVCACTYQRPEMLTSLLDGLIEQNTHGRFTYSIVIVDNDPMQSAKDIVSEYILQNSVNIVYHHEPTKGLSYARNASLKYSSGDYVAIIDDDEVPVSDWLYQLYKTLHEYDADAVFGSVLPNFEVEPPEWVMKRKVFYWRDVRPVTGVESDKAVTNNVLIKRKYIDEYNLKFDHDFAQAGGEDQDFFYQLKVQKKDCRYIDSKEAVVYEFLPADRCHPDYIQKRNLLESKSNVFCIKKYNSTSKTTKTYQLIRRFVQSYFRLLFFSLSFPFFMLFDKNIGADYYYKSFFHLGILLALFDISLYGDRKSIGLQ